MKNLIIRILLAAASVSWAGPEFGPSTGVEFFNGDKSVVLKGGEIRNSSRENATGSLKLQLWATDSRYSGGSIRGTLLASSGQLDGLGPGQYYEDVIRTEEVNRPGTRRSYYITLCLTEYRSGGYVIVDHRTMGSRRELGPPLPLFTMRGPWSWRWSEEGGTVEMSVAKISHTRSGHTGDLELSVWLTEQPYNGQGLRGHELGSVRKGQLKKGFVFNDVRNTATLVRPPPGTYYVTLALSESDGERFSVVAYLNADEMATFR